MVCCTVCFESCALKDNARTVVASVSASTLSVALLQEAVCNKSPRFIVLAAPVFTTKALVGGHVANGLSSGACPCPGACRAGNARVPAV